MVNPFVGYFIDGKVMWIGKRDDSVPRMAKRACRMKGTSKVKTWLSKRPNTMLHGVERQEFTGLIYAIFSSNHKNHFSWEDEMTF